MPEVCDPAITLMFDSLSTPLHFPNILCFNLEQEMVTVNVDGSVLDRIAKIMSYLRLGSSGKVLKKKKKEKDAKGIVPRRLFVK